MKISEINQFLQSDSYTITPNYIKLLTHCNNFHKLSVVGHSLKDKYRENIYHGIHPKINTAILNDFFLNNAVFDADCFWSKIDDLILNNQAYKYSNFFNLVPNHDFDVEEIERLFLGRAILRMADHYGLKLEIKDTKQNLSNLIKKIEFHQEELSGDFYNYQYRFIEYKLTHDSLTVTIKGFPPKSLICLFDDYQFTLKKGEKKYLSNNHPESVSIREIYNNPNSAKNLSINGDYIYYSGVMPRVEQIIVEKNQKDAPHMLFIKLLLGRTTFLTLDCFDNPWTINHPYFNFSNVKKGEMLYNFDCLEDSLQDSLLYTENQYNSIHDETVLNDLNEYLNLSMNTHTLAVSANVETSEEYLLITERAKNSIDSQTYYCSVNGQTEFFDKNVDFYQNSVYEDLPTMHFDNDIRIDFTYEMAREALAELGLVNFENQWNIIGLSMLAINNQHTKITNRRMHFNLLMENKTISNFKEIYDKKDINTESFEHSDLLAYKIKVFENRIMKLKSDVGQFMNWMLNQQIYSIPIVTLLFLLIIIKYQNPGYDFEKIAESFQQHFITDSITWLIILFLIVLHSVKWFLDNRKVISKRRVVIYNRKKHADLFRFIRKHHKNFPKYNVVTRVMIILHYINK